MKKNSEKEMNEEKIWKIRKIIEKNKLYWQHYNSVVKVIWWNVINKAY